MSVATPMPSPRVSVIIPVHNAERFIAAAVRSALDPSFPEVEVLVIDDGSTDGSASAARTVADPRVTVLQTPASGGPSRPRNIGLGRARAPYLALLDADDLLKPGKLSAAVTALDACPDAGFAFGDFERIEVDGRIRQGSAMESYPDFLRLPKAPLGGGWYRVPQSQLARGLLYENFIGTSGVVLRKQVIAQTGGFDESLAYSEDRDLWFRLAHRSDALYSERIGHSYRHTPGSLSYGSGVRNARHRIQVLQRERARWSEHAARRQINRMIAENYGILGYSQRMEGQCGPAMRSFVQALLTCPDARWVKGMVAAALRVPTTDPRT